MAAGLECAENIPEKSQSDIVSEDSSDSESDRETTNVFHRRVSTSKSIKSEVCLKEGFLLKQTTSFQRWKKRYFVLKPRKLYYAKDKESVIFEEIELVETTIAECSTKNANHSFQVITPFRKMVLSSETRKEMEDWILSLKSVSKKEFYNRCDTQRREQLDLISGQHNWYVTSHTRPTFCNICRGPLKGMYSRGLSCEICKFKSHRKCAAKAPSNCKWTTLNSIEKELSKNKEGNTIMVHQWLEGNLPVSAKCTHCDKTCGSVLRLQDWRCLWCKALVHSSCKESFPSQCSLGTCQISVVPPIILTYHEDLWEILVRPLDCSPLLVFVNSKSGDNQGVKFLRRLKQLFNPIQVYDLMHSGPSIGLQLFQSFQSFRVLVCGGDGSISWVLSEMDKMNISNQCQLGVLPLGTGNDLARVLGWGSVYDDLTVLPQFLEKYERAVVKRLDRWSIMTYEGTKKFSSQDLGNPIIDYENSVVDHLTQILQSDQHSVVISSAKVLCQTVKNFIAKVGEAYSQEEQEAEVKDSIGYKCAILNEKLGLLLQTLNEEALTLCTLNEEEDDEVKGDNRSPEKQPLKHLKMPVLLQKEALMSRANSLKKAVRQIIEHTEKAVDEQNAQTKQLQKEGESPQGTDTWWESGGSHSRAESSTCTSPSVPLSPILSPQPPPEFRDEPDPETSVLKPYCDSPTPSRRISSGSSLKHVMKILPKDLNKSPKHFPIINPLTALPMWPTLNQDSFIGKMLLANADTLCAAASPLMGVEEISMEGFQEKCVMNNYFGIGLDAKITLDFHNKREEHPEKCRSRTKNLMWYGVLGGKELLQKSFKNLEQRVHLQCDGYRIPLPSLQGIVVLNIPSYGGGSNFWGITKENEIFFPPNFDDKILEVVAVFGTVQMAASRVMNLQYHRIAQCRSVCITILGDEGVPVQVDGEAWIQAPGYISIIHKNKTQVLCRNRQLESSLRAYHDRRGGSLRPFAPLSDDELIQINEFVEVVSTLVKNVRTISATQPQAEKVFLPFITRTDYVLEKFIHVGKIQDMANLRQYLTDLVLSARQLSQESLAFINTQRLPSELETMLLDCLTQMEAELGHCFESQGMIYFYGPHEDIGHPGGGIFKMKFRKRSSSKRSEKEAGENSGAGCCRPGSPTQPSVLIWGTEQVSQWLESIQMGEYKDIFIQHDIQGPELLYLERRDLKELGITKVGHIKRILHAIKELVSYSVGRKLAFQ